MVGVMLTLLHNQSIQTSIPKALAYVSGALFEQYIHDMKLVQHFAMLNRQAIMDEIIKA